VHTQMHVHLPCSHMHVNPLLHLTYAKRTMVHVHLHAHWQSCGDPAPPSCHAELPPRAPFGDEAASGVAAPLWEELFMSPSSTVVADPDVVSCALAPRHESVRTAREFTKLTLNRWELPELFDDIALVASELVTNALRHALAPAAVHAPEQRVSGWGRRGAKAPISQKLDAGDAPSPLIRLSLVRRAPQVVCAVSDPSTSGPVAREADFIAESGRGLHLVDSFSRSWGWHPVTAGKVVWALFDLSCGEEERYGGP
jgi:hypothetical protein